MRIDIMKNGKYVDSFIPSTLHGFEFREDNYTVIPNCSLFDFSKGDELRMITEGNWLFFHSSYSVIEEDEEYWLLHTPDDFVRTVTVGDLKNCKVEVRDPLAAN